MTSHDIPTTGTRTSLHPEIQKFLSDNPGLHLGGEEDFHAERRHHLEVFGIHAIPQEKIHPIDEVEFTAIRGPHGTIPLRVLYPKAAAKGSNGAAALIYFHGGGYTVGSVDEFENGLRLLAEESGAQVYAADYRLAPEFRYPTQLDEYSAIIDALQGDFGSQRGVAKNLVFGGGDSAGGNMTAAIALRRRDEGKGNIAGQMLYYPEARVPFDTPAATENNTGLYLECNGIFSFADHYLPRGVTPAFKYISPGMQSNDELKGVPPARVFTSGFDPLRDVGVEYAHKLSQVGVDVKWRHYEDCTHGWLQMTAWSLRAQEAVKDSAKDLKEMIQSIK
ncbi:hypothetical protein BAUCODRAFT_29819 [Baudoinia panamericana UAMH 10762]|uniref:Alpha/beta hydrolase fold-3 domain-containing protein n=1 Tax=Baudoinia panamericana (strain UAMH 10762) TaxID=717646 RepID=M2LXQ3_BAUPA|nr:uncharacterized protein BAUCODRAFT_29819 [Baudoinia panamericana UAMH 10762]EMC99467.1 hypothetical protein BAUCODRAFT_29819 [Baudoinia panamericana UAMH 10762]